MDYNTVARLTASTYRFKDDRWEYESCGDWIPSLTLEEYNYEDGWRVIAECPWARLEEEHG